MDVAQDPLTAQHTPSPIPSVNAASPAPTEEHALPTPGLSYATNPEDNMDIAPPDNQVNLGLAGPEVSVIDMFVDQFILTLNVAL